MKKRIVSLLCVLALCLGLLPTTALAAGEIELYVAGQRITESGCYANQDGTWTKVDGTEPASGQFYYDADTITLTLNGAEISHNEVVSVGSGTQYRGSVIAFSQSADVSLNIVVSQGTSTITGNGGIRVESTTGNASLSIKGPGSLDVEPNGTVSGITLCSSKNRNLDIDGADVTASSPDHYGVYLISSTDATSTSTITVNNGSLTTGGNGNVGIYYYWSGTNNAGTSSLTVSGNAVVDTRNSRILTNNEETGVQVGAGSDGNGGIVFDGKNGTVYGDVTLQEDLEIGKDETLTIGKDASLTVPEGTTLTNDGTITVESGGKLEGTPTGEGSVVYKVTGVTLDQTDLTLFTGQSEQLTATVTPDNATNKNVTWSTSDATIATVQEGTVTAVAAGTATITVTTEDGSHTATCTVSVKDPVYSMSTDTAVLSFDSKTEGYADAPAAKTVTITNTGNQPLTLAQPSSTANFEVGTLSAKELPVNGTATFTVQPKTGLAAGNYEETITVTATDGQYNVATNVTVKFAVAQKSVSGSDTSTPDDSVYYTCPACGYHNWTATDAGYRCDHCGYLESVKQLSGYANVKGTYTPGTAAVTVPQTGDQSSPALWVALLSVSGLALCGLVLCRRRQH